MTSSKSIGALVTTMSSSGEGPVERDANAGSKFGSATETNYILQHFFYYCLVVNSTGSAQLSKR